MIRDFAQDVAGGLEDFFGRLSAVDWILIGLAMLLVIWIVLSLRATTRIGPITVEALTYDGEDKIPVQALTARLRETLARVGFSTPMAVPAGAPQADLIAAVEASGAPQAAFMAKLLQAMPRPRPPEYTISGVLAGVEPGPPKPPWAGDEPPKPETPCSLSYWVRPAREGAPYLHTVSKQSKHLDSVDKAACGIYLHISQHAETAFPGWARWTEAGAVEAYADGRLHLRNDEWPEAIERYTQAAAADRLNVLARLVLTNLYEVLITQPDDADRALAQSRVLRSYLDVACQWPSLVEPRYRASIVAATLASTCNVLLPEHQGQVRATLQLPGDPPDLTVAMRELASRESKAAVQLLKGWYVLVREGRLRTLFEPRGSDRRRLLHTVRISEHCLRLRSFTAISPFRRAEVRMRSLLVHVGVTFLGQGEMSWQARYNAACFDSLLLRYLERYAASPMNPVWQSARKRRVRARGLRALDRAIKDAGRELSPDWIWRDPDLDSLKSAARWKEIVGAPPDPETTAPALMPPEHATPYRALPSAPWPYLRLRAVFWGAVAIAGVVLFWFTESRWWWVAVGIGVWRARRALWELGVTAQVWRPIRAVADSVWRWVRQLGRRFDYGA